MMKHHLTKLKCIRKSEASTNVDHICERLFGIYGNKFFNILSGGVLHVTSIVENKTDKTRQPAWQVIQINEISPRSEIDWFLLNIARSTSDRVLQSAKTIRDEPNIIPGLQGGFSEALFDWRSNYHKISNTEKDVTRNYEINVVTTTSSASSTGSQRTETDKIKTIDLNHPYFNHIPDHYQTRDIKIHTPASFDSKGNTRSSGINDKVGDSTTRSSRDSVDFRSILLQLPESYNNSNNDDNYSHASSTSASSCVVECGANVSRQLYASGLVDTLLLSVYQPPPVALDGDIISEPTSTLKKLNSSRNTYYKTLHKKNDQLQESSFPSKHFIENYFKTGDCYGFSESFDCDSTNGKWKFGVFTRSKYKSKKII